ncbi:hypothetical protein Tco_0455250 [Tanacetum coccineum]
MCPQRILLKVRTNLRVTVVMKQMNKVMMKEQSLMMNQLRLIILKQEMMKKKHKMMTSYILLKTIIDAETNNESNDVTEEEYERINEELYGDVNVSNQIKDDAQATQKTDAPIPSSSISSDYAAKFLNSNNILLTETEVISMMDINVQHEVPRTSSLLTIPVSVIPEQDIIS